VPDTKQAASSEAATVVRIIVQLTAAVHTRPRADVARGRELCRIAPRYDDIWLGSHAR
jgi:hypothetical protein